MSYSVYLTDKKTGEVLTTDTPHLLRGGTYCPYGTDELWLNITYNYSQIYKRVLGPEGINTINGMSGGESLTPLWRAAQMLDDDMDDNYWRPTEGNAKAALMNLFYMATLKPEGIWRID